MALALLVATALAAIGFLVAAASGLALAGHLGAGAMAGFLVRRHVLLAIPAVLLSLFSQSMVIFYFIGTGRLIKDAAASMSEEKRRMLSRSLRRMKARTSPPATFGMLAAIAVFVVGGWLHTAPPGARSLARLCHIAATFAALACHVWAVAADYPAFVETARLMDGEGLVAARGIEPPT